jgi:hypothetical protein
MSLTASTIGGVNYEPVPSKGYCQGCAFSQWDGAPSGDGCEKPGFKCVDPSVIWVKQEPAQTQSDTKPSNPKDLIGSSKLPMNLVPDTLQIMASMAFAEGASKYGAFNWRSAGVRSSIYKAAHDRHMSKWWNGEDVDAVTKVPHLASAMACLAIIADARLCGKLTDDRPPVADMDGLIKQAEAVVAGVMKLNADKHPHHFTIKDAA